MLSMVDSENLVRKLKCRYRFIQFCKTFRAQLALHLYFIYLIIIILVFDISLELFLLKGEKKN